MYLGTLGKLVRLACKAFCMRLSSFLGGNSHTEGRGNHAHKLSPVTRSWSGKGRSKSADSIVLGAPGPVPWSYTEAGMCPHQGGCTTHGTR